MSRQHVNVSQIRFGGVALFCDECLMVDSPWPHRKEDGAIWHSYAPEIPDSDDAAFILEWGDTSPYARYVQLDKDSIPVVGSAT